MNVIESQVLHVTLATIAAVVVAALATRVGALSGSGFAAAVLVGAGVVIGAGWNGGILLMCFFATSSALSRLRGPAGDNAIQHRGSRRDAVQVLANGGAATVLALLSSAWNPGGALTLAFCAAIATANADTWSTELGKRSRSTPRLILTFRPVPAGTSGAISALGTVAALGGAALIGSIAAMLVLWSFQEPAVAPLVVFLSVSVAGLGGALIDSVLGATVQGIWRCPSCGARREVPVDACGVAGTHVSGLPFVTNDVVNAWATGAGALIALLGKTIS